MRKQFKIDPVSTNIVSEVWHHLQDWFKQDTLNTNLFTCQCHNNNFISVAINISDPLSRGTYLRTDFPIPPFCHFAILSFRHSVISPFCHFAILSFHQIASPCSTQRIVFKTFEHLSLIELVSWSLFEYIKFFFKVSTMCRSNLFRYICKEKCYFFQLRVGDATVKLFWDVYNLVQCHG